MPAQQAVHASVAAGAYWELAAAHRCDEGLGAHE